jgi:hypothetical protein
MGDAPPPRQRTLLPHYRRLWSPDDLITKAKQWVDAYDRPPSSPEWNPWHAQNSRSPVGVDRIERFYEGEWPYVSTVIAEKHRRPWGTSWNRFLEAAGFTPLPHSYHYVTDDDGVAIRIDGKRLIRHNGWHDIEYLEGDRPPTRKRHRTRRR